MLYLIFCFSLAGCASALQSGIQTVGISSNPSEAEVYVNGEFKGATPILLDLDRKGSYLVKIKKPGYQEASTTLTSKLIGGLDVYEGGLLRQLWDRSSGAAYELSTNQVHINLVPEKE